MIYEHDPAWCETVSCELCDAFYQGYTEGKKKGRDEIETWDDTHARSCACAPCRIVRGIMGKAGGIERGHPGPHTPENPAVARECLEMGS